MKLVDRQFWYSSYFYFRPCIRRQFVVWIACLLSWRESGFIEYGVDCSVWMCSVFVALLVQFVLLLLLLLLLLIIIIIIIIHS